MSVSDGNAILRFYYPLPVFGEKMSRQWPKFREDFNNLAPLVRAAYIDLQPASNHNAGENDLAGWAIGERDFRNKFRIWYSKTEDMFKIQFNSGTEDVPAWNDAMQIRESDLRITATGPGGIAAPTGGFYTDIPRQLAITQDFPLSSEWQFHHNLDSVPIIWDTFRSNNISIVPAKVDVGDPNIAYFYFNTPVAGKAMAVAGQARGNGINFTDGTNIYYNKLQLDVNSDDFYLSRDLQGHPVLNLQPIDINNFDTSQLIRADGTNPFSGDQSMGGHHLTNVATPVSAGDAVNKAYADALPPEVGLTNGVGPNFTNVSRITFRQEDFYLDTDSSGQPVVNIRGGAGGGGSSGQFGTGISAADFALSNEWILNHNLGVANIIWSTYDDQGMAIIPDKVSVHNTNTAYFYFSPATAGRAVVGGGPVFQSSGSSVIVAETDGNPPSFTTGTIKFNSTDFYIAPDSSGNIPIINFRGTSGGGGSGITAVVQDPAPQLGGTLDINGHQITSANGLIITTGTNGGPSGTIEIKSDLATAVGADSGSISVSVGTSQQASGGDLSLSAGTAVTNGDGGSVDITAGDSNSGRGGNVNITPGVSALGSQGTVTIGVGTATGNEIVLLDPVTANSNLIHDVLDPVDPQDVATKNYVDTHTSSGGGGGFYGILWSDGTVTKRTDRLSFNGNDFYLDGFRPTLNIKPIFATKTYVDAGDAASVAAAGPGFYGIFIKESRAGATTYRNDTLIFDSGAFYINPTSIGKPMVSIRSNPGISSVSQDTSPVLGGNLNAGGFRITNLGAPQAATDAVRFGDLSPGFYGIFIRESDGNPPTKRDDTIIFDSAAFYINSDSKGKAMVSFRGTVGGSPGISGIDFSDGVHNITTKTKINFNPNHFYLSQVSNGDPMLNLRYEEDIFPVFIELGSALNVVIDPFAQYQYTLNRADIDCRTGSATGGFYIIPAISPVGLGVRVGRGQPVGNFDQLPITTTPTRVVPTTNRIVNPGDCLMFSLFGNSNAKHIRISLVARKPQ